MTNLLKPLGTTVCAVCATPAYVLKFYADDHSAHINTPAHEIFLNPAEYDFTTVFMERLALVWAHDNKFIGYRITHNGKTIAPFKFVNDGDIDNICIIELDYIDQVLNDIEPWVTLN